MLIFALECLLKWRLSTGLPLSIVPHLWLRYRRVWTRTNPIFRGVCSCTVLPVGLLSAHRGGTLRGLFFRESMLTLLRL